MNRNSELKDHYNCHGSVLPVRRSKSVEPSATYIDPSRMTAKCQSLHHFIAKSESSNEAVLGHVRNRVSRTLSADRGCYLIVDAAGLPKGRHSVAIARQSCGHLDKKQDNSQVAVSLSLASERGDLPITYQFNPPKGIAQTDMFRAFGIRPATTAWASVAAPALSDVTQEQFNFMSTMRRCIGHGFSKKTPCYQNARLTRRLLSSRQQDRCSGTCQRQSQRSLRKAMAATLPTISI